MDPDGSKVKCVVIKFLANGKYLRYMREPPEIAPSAREQFKDIIHASGHDPASPCARFYAEPSKSHNGFYHIRCSYNDKYMVPRKVEGRVYLFCNAEEPQDDISKNSCTLLRLPNFGNNRSTPFPELSHRLEESAPNPTYLQFQMATQDEISEELKNQILIPSAEIPNAYFLGPLGHPDPIEFIEKETLRIPFKSGVTLPGKWPDTFKAWPFPPIVGWRNWVRRMSDKASDSWEAQDIQHCLELSLSEMQRNDDLLIAASHFWSNATNSFVFGHGPMTITLADIFMMTGLNITEPVSPFKYKSSSSQKSVKSGGGWANYIRTYCSTGSVNEKEHRAFMNMLLCRFIFCGKSNEPTLNYMVMAEDLAAGLVIPLGKYLLGAVYHMMHQTTIQMFNGKEISCVNGPWWLVQIWLQLHMHQIISVDLHTLKFPSINYAEGADPIKKGCQTYGEAASAIVIKQDIGQLFKLLYKGFSNVLWLPYRENDEFTLPYKFSFDTCCVDQVAVKTFNAFIKPCTLPAEFHHGRLLHPTYEFYNPNMAARQLGCGQLPPRLYFSNVIKSRERLDQNLESARVFDLGNDLPLYEPDPFGIVDTAHPQFSHWWQEWHSHIFNEPVHPYCQALLPDFAPDSEDVQPLPPSRQVAYNTAGPIPGLGFDAPTLAKFMKSPASSDNIPLKKLQKRKKLTGSGSSVAKKPRSIRIKPSSKLNLQETTNLGSSSEILVGNQEIAEQTMDAENQRATTDTQEVDQAADTRQQDASNINQKSITDQAPSNTFSEGILSDPLHDAQNAPFAKVSNTGAGQDTQSEANPAEKDIDKPEPSFSFIAEKYIEQNEEASSHQQLSEENQARLRDIILLLNKDVDNLVQKAELIRDIWGSIDQEIPIPVKTALESASRLDDYYGKIKRASKITSAKTSIQQDIQSEEQKVKELYSQVQSEKDSLKTLKPELEAMEIEKAQLEVQLAILNTKIQAHKEKISSLPDSIKAAEANIISAVQKNRQLRAKLSNISSSEEDDHRAFVEVNHIRNNTVTVITSLLTAQSSCPVA